MKNTRDGTVGKPAGFVVRSERAAIGWLILLQANDNLALGHGGRPSHIANSPYHL